MNSTGVLFVYCVAILLASMLGGWVPLVLRPTHLRMQTYLSFASGTMLGAAVCHMMPEASHAAAESWFLWMLVGMVGWIFLERFLAFHHHEAHEHDVHGAGHESHAECAHGPHPHEPTHSPLAWGTALLGLSIHTLMGGFALASAVAAESDAHGWMGLSVFLATILHKPADSMTITGLMMSHGARTQSAHWINFGFALMIPLGVAFYFVFRAIGPAAPDAFAGGALAFSAGTFLSIALGDLMPELQFHRHDRLKLSVALLAGVLLMLFSAMVE